MNNMMNFTKVNKTWVKDKSIRGLFKSYPLKNKSVSKKESDNLNNRLNKSKCHEPARKIQRNTIVCR